MAVPPPPPLAGLPVGIYGVTFDLRTRAMLDPLIQGWQLTGTGMQIRHTFHIISTKKNGQVTFMNELAFISKKKDTTTLRVQFTNG
jgi:hypothetical protein